MSLASFSALVLPLVAQGNPSYNYAWAIVLICVILGVAVAVTPVKRTTEIKRKKDE